MPDKKVSTKKIKLKSQDIFRDREKEQGQKDYHYRSDIYKFYFLIDKLNSLRDVSEKKKLVNLTLENYGNKDDIS